MSALREVISQLVQCTRNNTVILRLPQEPLTGTQLSTDLTLASEDQNSIASGFPQISFLQCMQLYQ